MYKNNLRLLKKISIIIVFLNVISCSSEKSNEEMPEITPTILVQPTSPDRICAGSGTQIMSVSVTSVEGVSFKYVWRKNGVEISNNQIIQGQGTATLTLINTTISDAGNYDVVISNGKKEVVSTPVVVSVRDSGVIATVVGAAGKTWMAYNLGASKIATSANDKDAYGNNFQWGRSNDGHEEIRWMSNIDGSSKYIATNVLANNDIPSSPSFIITKDSNVSTDWRQPGNDNLWQGVNGINNPCPCGFRLPTEAEFDAEVKAAGITNAITAFNSPLKLVTAGMRDGRNGILDFEGRNGYYWTSSVDGSLAKMRYFLNTSTANNVSKRSFGYSIRCIKN